MTLAGTSMNAVGASLFVGAIDGVAPQYQGFLTAPWAIDVEPVASTTLIGWAFTQETPMFGDRGRRWSFDVSFVTTPADADAEGLVLDFGTDEPLTETSVSFVLPVGSRYFDDLTIPLVSYVAANPNGSPGALVAFPSETVVAGGMVTGTIQSPTLPVGELGFIGMQMSGPQTSSVFAPWEGAPPAAPLTPAFLRPPSVAVDTSDGVAFGDAVQWTSDEADVVSYVIYSMGDQNWAIQYFGASVGVAAPPTLPAATVDQILGSAIDGNAAVYLCDVTPVGCLRVVPSAAFTVTR